MGYESAIPMLGGLELRFATPADEDFLLDLFVAARPWLAMASDDRDFVRALCEDQKRIARIGLGTTYPNHLDFVVDKTGQAVGHLAVDLGQADWRISQLELHPLARGKGIGSDVMRSLQAAATRAMLPLSVGTLTELPRALAFHGRHGFRVVGQRPPVVELMWWPPLN